jgi:hypothetical protein
MNIWKVFTTIYFFIFGKETLEQETLKSQLQLKKLTGDNEIQHNAFDSMTRFHRSALNPVATHGQRGCYVPR